MKYEKNAKNDKNDKNGIQRREKIVVEKIKKMEITDEMMRKNNNIGSFKLGK